MSNYTTNATTVLNINGQQAQQQLNQLKQQAMQLESAIAKAAAAGNRTDLRRLRSELQQTKRNIQAIESSTMQVDRVLHRLNKATPKELHKALQTLNRQLEYLERGSSAWNAHVQKIQRIKTELAKLSHEMKQQESTWQRLNAKVNEWGASLAMAAAAASGLIMAGRKAVNSFADMEEQLANTRKYTGLSVDEVARLNESFAEMDTRTPREKLNELAQEAGRLGKNTVESVKGYVEAADIINVALVDLGEGATQTIAKLTNIFGVEQLLGTKDAMLAVGSAVNVLSQNCTASKQYLVEFTQRMAGVGAQADLTIPQLLAFGATLDANGQKTEMSASALGKLTMMLFQKPTEVAQQVGLNVEEFNETLKRSTNEGLMMFLQRIHDLGSKDGLAVLAPLFKDLGMDGVRMSQVLSTLAEHLDMVKWEQEEAAKAFRDASSASNEYQIFNSTTQAGIDKAKNHIHELAVQLGEKLMPVMRHVMTTGTATMKLLNLLVDFIIRCHRELAAVALSIAAYVTATHAATAALRLHNAALTVTRTLMMGANRATLLLKMGFFAMTGQIAKAKDALRAFNLLTKSSPWGVISAAITAVVTGLALFSKRQREARAEQERLQKANAEWKRSLTDVDTASDRYCANELARLKSLYAEATNEAKSKELRQQAAEKLQKLFPSYFANLSTEAIMVGQAKTQYDTLTESILQAARARAAAAKMEENEREMLTLEETLGEQQGTLASARSQYQQAQRTQTATEEQHRPILNDAALGDAREMNSNAVQASVKAISNANAAVKSAKDAMTEAQHAVDETSRKINALSEANAQLAEKYQVAQKVFQNDETTVANEESITTAKADDSDRFAQEKAWRTKEEALARIAYATGQTDYQAYTNRMNEIAVQFYEKQLQHADLSSNERLTIEASYHEAKRKQEETFTAQTVEEENLRYQEQLMTEKQHFLNGEYSLETYHEAIKRAELDHLKNLSLLAAEGSKERLEAARNYQNRLLEEQEKAYKKAEEEAKKHEAELKKIKDGVFGNNPAENRAAYELAVSNLDEVYAAELAAAEGNAQEKRRIDRAYHQARIALARQYNQSLKEENVSGWEFMVEEVTSFLNSEGGEALTSAMDTLISGMAAIFCSLSSLIEAELEMQTAAIERRYNAEVKFAEGNSYKITKLEEQKNHEIAEAKNEANRKMFAMQVVQAVAQTAQNALAAYGSAAAIPLIGFIMAPIAAAMAVTAGALQIAAIKKQQQASEAQGYAEGGFTPKGRKYDAVGVVHAGEWVASQELLADPSARAIINTLDYAQRTNTIGQVRGTVGREATVPAASLQTLLTPSPAADPMLHSLETVIASLNTRLDQPFVTVNTVTGEFGIEKAQNDYQKFIRNKSPRRRY